MNKNKVKYTWVATSDDGAYHEKCVHTFDSKKDCYNNMRDAVLEKMKWNTEYDEDFADMESEDDYIGYHVQFQQNQIVHESYSGVYTYQIVEAVEEKTFRFIIDVHAKTENETQMGHVRGVAMSVLNNIKDISGVVDMNVEIKEIK